MREETKMPEIEIDDVVGFALICGLFVVLFVVPWDAVALADAVLAEAGK